MPANPSLTAHLLTINPTQLHTATHHPFLSRAANGTLPKPLIGSWLSNDRVYLQGYTNLNSSLLAQIRSRTASSTKQPSNDDDVEKRLSAWLEAGVQNGQREMKLFAEVAEKYGIELHASPLPEHVKLEGLRRYESLFARVSAQLEHPHAFLPWLEGVTLLWATEIVYYKAWSWARAQDSQSSPRTFDNDEDGGAMRREFIPNWANREFLAFVEELEGVLNDGVEKAAAGGGERWEEVKTRAEGIWKALLDAEEVFWPDVPEAKGE